ncbi:MAG TPA: DUF6259 domain-containing protein [Kiritimatiellia bacterium]|nr:DUF6259 domain-containing protein [Kiritimatiellia bacterium]HRU70255.1 DUF6259 domain-containing protein [Kiritimatiellia bacterium]
MRSYVAAGWFMLVGAAVQAWAGDLIVTVRNGAQARENVVVAQRMTHAWAAAEAGAGLAERHPDGRVMPVPYAVDRSGETPVLVWQMPGTTAPDAVRRFVWRADQASCTTPGGDLVVSVEDSRILIANSFFKLTHPVRGRGGFPQDVEYVRSGHADRDLYFLDRIVRKDAEGRLMQYCANACEDAVARVVFSSPLRAVVEVRTGFGKRSAATPGQPQAVYRYTYSAHAPVVQVEARYTRTDDGPWRELHFLHLSRKEARYTHFVTGDAGDRYPLQPKGTRSRAVNGAQWAVMADATDACGVGFGGATCWDASDEFVYYIRSGHMTWQGPEAQFEGGLYFGPAGDSAWYSQWLGREREPEITLYRDGRLWVPVERDPPEGAYRLENAAMRIVFAGAEQGFDCTGIENLLAEDTRFVRARDNVPGLWSLTFKTPADTAGQQETAVLSNLSPSLQRRAVVKRRQLTFAWEGIDLPDEPGAVDVRAEVSLDAGEGASAWRIRVTNRSRRFGLWETAYPLLNGVVPPGVGDALLPTGNWGGRLMRQHRGQFDAPYPSARCPLQMMAFQLGEAGLYLAAHDGAATAKRLSVNAAQDVTFHTLAEQAGVTGAEGAPAYPVVIAAYRGDWWQAARRYREWATRQAWAAKGPLATRADFPPRLQDLGFWMLLSGAPATVTNNMARAARLFPDMPIGVHWYNWHQIPFDHTYPEYFPTKPGMAEATRAMTANGQTVMPYINARLWDEEIPSFATAFPAAAKQPNGTNYVEIYGSKRRLVPMCAATPFWQSKVQEICLRLMDECGVNAIYLDQIGAARPAPCYDPSHGHPLGGGGHWTAGYRKMMTPVKREASRRNVVLTTENTAEPYMDTIDAYLAWNPREQQDVPLLPAVYSGYTVYFTSPQAAQDSLDAFCAAQARDFLWGCQLGWNGEWILQPPHSEKQQFQRELCRYRLAARAFMVDGQLVDELRPLNEVPLVTHLWHRTHPHTARLPAVMGTLWRDASRKRLALVMVNTTGVAQTFDIRVEPERWLKGNGAWHLHDLTPSGERLLRMPEDGRVRFGDLAPREIRVFILARPIK